MRLFVRTGLDGLRLSSPPSPPFVDIGLEKAAFLYVGDYLDAAAQFDGAVSGDSSRRGGRGRNSQPQMPRIESLLGEGQEIVVQIAKEPIGTKGARVTSHISMSFRTLRRILYLKWIFTADWLMTYSKVA